MLPTLSATIEDGTCHDGLKITPMTRVENCGVGKLGLPMITLWLSISLPFSINRTRYSGRLTIRYLLPGLCGSQRQRSREVAICLRLAGSAPSGPVSALRRAAYSGFCGANVSSTHETFCAVIAMSIIRATSAGSSELEAML